MDFDQLFEGQLTKLKDEGNYRIFAELERRCGTYPKATNYYDDGTREVTVWCSNDYLGMGQHPKVVAEMCRVAEECGAGAGGTRNISGTNYHHRRLERRTGRPPPERGRTPLLLGLRLELGLALDARLRGSRAR